MTSSSQTASRAGATHVVNTSAAELHDTAAELTDGRGPDVVIEAIGLPQTFRAAVEEVAFTGRVVYIGYAKEHVAYETRLFVQKELDILGSRNALPEDFRDVIRMLESHRFPVEEAVTHLVPMEEAPAILEAWNREPAGFTKIMINVSLTASTVLRRVSNADLQVSRSGAAGPRARRRRAGQRSGWRRSSSLIRLCREWAGAREQGAAPDLARD